MKLLTAFILFAVSAFAQGVNNADINVIPKRDSGGAFSQTGTIRFRDQNGHNVGFRAPDTVAASETLITAVSAANPAVVTLAQAPPPGSTRTTITALAQPYVQSAVQSLGDGNTSVNKSFASTPTVGHYALAGCIIWSDAGGGATACTSVSDNHSNTWTRVKANHNPGRPQQQTELWCAPIATSSGTFTVTAATATAGFMTLIIAEYNGITSCTAESTAAGNGFGTAMDSGPLGATTNHMIVGLVSADSGAGPTWSVGAGENLRQGTTNNIYELGGWLSRPAPEHSRAAPDLMGRRPSRQYPATTLPSISTGPAALTRRARRSQLSAISRGRCRLSTRWAA